MTLTKTSINIQIGSTKYPLFMDSRMMYPLQVASVVHDNRKELLEKRFIVKKTFTMEIMRDKVIVTFNDRN